MKVFTAILAIVSMAVAALQTQDPALAAVVRSGYVQDPEGSYNFVFETNNGINRNEDGKLKQVLDEDNNLHGVVAVRGSYSYVDPTGQKVSVSYYADETGYHADGDSIPKTF